jgi:hypothetical protein
MTVTPGAIVQAGFGFGASKTLLSAVEPGVFVESNNPNQSAGLK